MEVTVTTEIPTAPIVWRKFSIAAIIERFIVAMDGTPEKNGLRTLGDSHRYALRAIQRTAFGQLDARKYKKQDVKDYCNWRFHTEGVCAATINQNVCYVSGALEFAASEWDDCDDVTVKPIRKARKSLMAHNLIGKGTRRKRVPTTDEIARLKAYLAEGDKTSKIRMVEVFEFALWSTRRISEICRMTHGDIDWEHVDETGEWAPMYTVRDLKHPTKKKGNDKTFPMLDPLPEIILRQPRLNANDPTERVFPFNAKSCGRRYTEAKKVLGIENLHFHDNRREGTTRWLKKFPPHKVKLITGHEKTDQVETTYDGQNPDSLHSEVAAMGKSKPGQAAA